MSENGYVARWVWKGFDYYFTYNDSSNSVHAKFKPAYVNKGYPLVLYTTSQDYDEVRQLMIKVLSLAEVSLSPVNIQPHPDFDDGSWICDFVRPEEVVIA